MAPQVGRFLRRQRKAEFLREPGFLPSDGAIERLGLNPIELLKIRVQHYLLTANRVDSALKLPSFERGRHTCYTIDPAKRFHLANPPSPGYPNAVSAPPAPLILLAFPDKKIAIILEMMLNRNGYAVKYAFGALSCLRLMRTSAPQALILNRTLPGLDAFEVLRRLKSDAATGPIPVIVTSALPFSELAMAAGAAGFLQKPFRESVMLEAIQKARSASSATPWPQTK